MTQQSGNKRDGKTEGEKRREYVLHIMDADITDTLLVQTATRKLHTSQRTVSTTENATADRPIVSERITPREITKKAEPVATVMSTIEKGEIVATNGTHVGGGV